MLFPRRVQQPFPFPFLFRFHVTVAVVDVVRVIVHGEHLGSDDTAGCIRPATTYSRINRLGFTNGTRVLYYHDYRPVHNTTIEKRTGDYRGIEIVPSRRRIQRRKIGISNTTVPYIIIRYARTTCINNTISYGRIIRKKRRTNNRRLLRVHTSKRTVLFCWRSADAYVRGRARLLPHTAPHHRIATAYDGNDGDYDNDVAYRWRRLDGVPPLHPSPTDDTVTSPSVDTAAVWPRAKRWRLPLFFFRFPAPLARLTPTQPRLTVFRVCRRRDRCGA